MTDALRGVAEAQAHEWGLALTGEQWASLEAFSRLLHSYEEANVIGTKDLRGIIVDHVLDSLSCLLFEPLRDDGRLADVGSGGGLPGIPLSIANPELATTLVESTGKKARFLRYAVESLSLGIEVANARVEDLANGEGERARFRFATSRAVARLSVVLEYCIPLLQVGGHVVSMKGKLEGEEFREGKRAAGVLRARVVEVIRVPMLPEIGQKERHLIVFEKLEGTPAKYPRGVGVPAKRPLGAA